MPLNHQTRAVTRRKCLLAAMTAATAAGCGRRSADQRGRQLRVFNWSDYVDPVLIADFEEQASCRVIYDNYSSDAELETRLATGGGTYDVVFPSDRAMAALLAKGLLQKLDVSRLANASHLDAKFLRPPFDPSNDYSVPYFWGTLAVGVRSDRMPGPVAGFEALFDPAYRRRITMLDDLENVAAAVLAYLGLPLNSAAAGDLARVKEVLLAQRPLVQAYTSDAYKERLISGQAWVSLGWSGDLMQASAIAAEHGVDIQVVVPAAGTLIWLDSLAIPQAAPHVALAHEFIDYLLRPDVAAQNAVHVRYATPNQTAVARLPADLRGDECVYPPLATLARCDWLRDRGAEIEKIEAIWREVRQ